jgi:hypothetical protein
MKLIHIAEPQLRFGYSQPTEDPRDGLMLFGPLAKGNVFGIRAGVVGTSEGIRRYKLWVKRIQSPISCARTLAESLYTPTYPGFQTVFQIPWHSEPIIEAVIDPDKLKETVLLAERQQRVFQTVDLYASKILESRREDESEVDLWFVIVPDEVSRYCRPKSNVEPSLQRTDESLMRRKEAKGWISEPSLFDEMNTAVEPFQFEPDFHNQLKAKLLLKEIPTQVVQESTLTPEEFVSETGRPLRRVDKPSTIAWNLTTAAFYKASGRPWKLNRVRMGVCYLGLVFKRDDRAGDERNACCAAQMFLDSGDGVVFKGAVGPWYSGRGDYHLTRAAAKQVVQLAIESYKRGNNSLHPPSELFIHGRTRFNDEEWQGFQDAVGRKTQVVGVRIRQSKDLKLYSPNEYPIMRGSAYIQDARAAYLWTVGYTPRLQTYVGKEVPNPLYIEISRGSAAIDRVCADVLALTKLNYNACIYGDGEPVTLKFADAVGEILTAAPFKKDAPPLPFKYYI